MQYRLSEEKTQFNSTTLGFYQTYLNIPVTTGSGFLPIARSRSITVSRASLQEDIGSDNDEISCWVTVTPIGLPTQPITVKSAEQTLSVVPCLLSFREFRAAQEVRDRVNSRLTIACRRRPIAYARPSLQPLGAPEAWR